VEGNILGGEPRVLALTGDGGISLIIRKTGVDLSAIILK